jgi:nitrite reductase (NADH) small subunit
MEVIAARASERGRELEEAPMPERLAGQLEDFDENRRRIVTIEDREVVVLRSGDSFYALDNWCLHMGGPVGEGMLIGKVESVLSEDKCHLGDRFSDTETHLVCPWHGWEYNVKTGEAAAARSMKLRTYKTEVRGEDVYVIS